MLLLVRRACAAAAAISAVVVAEGSLSQAQQPAPAASLDGSLQRVSRFRPGQPELPEPGGHPLAAVIDYARKEQRYLQQSIKDFACRLVKRERIGGYLQELQYIDMQVREHVAQGNTLVQPLSIYLHFMGPRLVAGRKVLYVEGRHDGKMLVRNGGRHFEYVVVEIDPHGDSAREETLVPVTDIGFTRLLAQMINVLERHRQADPTGENSLAEQISGAKVNQRTCTVIRVTHPRPMNGLEFHVANVFVDDELHVPVRVDYSGWPKTPDGPAPLIAEYTYTDLRLNVELPEGTFNPSRLRSRDE